MLSWDRYSLLFIWRVGVLVIRFTCRAAAAARFPFEGDTFSPPERSVGGERGRVVRPDLSGVMRRKAARYFHFCRRSCAESGTSDGPFVACGTSFFDAGVRAERVPAWLRVTRPLVTLEQ